MSEGLITSWRSIIPLWRSIQPINILTSAGQQSCFDRIHSKLGICLWLPPGAALHTYLSTDSTGAAHCEQRNPSQALRGAKRSTAVVSWAAAVGQAVLSQRCLPGVYPGEREGEQTGNCFKSSLSSQQHATLQRRCRFFHSHPPCFLQAAVELKYPCEKQMTAQVCSPRAAVLVLSGHHGTRHCSGTLGCPPYPGTCCFSRHARCWEKGLHLSLQPCTSASGVGHPWEWDFRGICLSSHFTIFCRNVLLSLVHVHIQPHSLLGCEGTGGRVGTRLHCQMVTEMRLHPRTLLEVLFLPCIYYELSRLLEKKNGC